jgi:hypothetical protein
MGDESQHANDVGSRTSVNHHRRIECMPNSTMSSRLCSIRAWTHSLKIGDEQKLLDEQEKLCLNTGKQSIGFSSFAGPFIRLLPRSSKFTTELSLQKKSVIATHELYSESNRSQAICLREGRPVYLWAISELLGPGGICVFDSQRKPVCLRARGLK